MNLMRQTNRRLILNLVQEKGPLSRGEITKQTNLGVITVTKIIRDLIRENLIYESGFGVSQGGRRPVLLNFNFSSVFALGIGIEVNDDLVGIVTDLKNQVILKRRKKVIAWTKEIEVIQSIIEMIEKILKQLGKQSPKIGGIGIGVPGLVNQKRGRVKSFHKFSQWKEMSLGDIINKKFKLPVFIDNNNSCAILAEKIMGAGKGRENFLYINLGEGIGLGIIIRGQVYQGRDGDAGEFGHIVIEPNGPRCYCGNRGCLETLISSSAIIKRTLKILREGVDSKIPDLVKGNLRRVNIKVIEEAARKGDKIAYNVIESTGEYLGRGIASLINLFNPEIIILGGTLTCLGKQLLSSIRRTVKKETLPLLANRVKIVFSELDHRDVVARGSAALVWEKKGERGEFDKSTPSKL